MQPMVFGLYNIYLGHFSLFFQVRALLNKSELADRMALYYTCYPILTLCGIPNNVIRFSALTIA
ncbi:MAG: hypothetical protein ACR5LH_07095, partial [Sodalis sp. (in: enterobacteria)]